MSPENPGLTNKQTIWRIAGVWMVVLALGLAAIGTILALQQPKSLTIRLNAEAKLRAGQTALVADLIFEQQLNCLLNGVFAHLSVSDKEWDDKLQPLPPWTDGLFLVRHESFSTLVPPATTEGAVAEFAQSESVGLLARTSLGMAVHTVLLSDDSMVPPVALGMLGGTDVMGRKTVVAVGIDPSKAIEVVVEPLVAMDDALEIVPSGQAIIEWSQPLYGAMRSFAIQPAVGFIAAQRQTAVTQTLTYLALTILALVTLLAAMWALSRMVRREVALAQMKSNFVADVSHELKTPLALIRLFSETLQSGRVQSEEKREEYYAIITRESTRLSNLINNILDFSRLEAGRKEYSLQSTDVASVVRETYEAYTPELEHHGFEHHLDIADSLPTVDADRDAISRALLNLMSNAVKYSDDRRFLSVDVQEDVRRGRRGVVISVHDEGIGIKPEDRARLFDGFFRASDERVHKQRGAGIGLALVKHIVDAHHGFLSVESRLVKGSTFRIFLPASEPGEPPSSQDSNQGSNLA